jgi:hypothetical protein
MQTVLLYYVIGLVICVLLGFLLSLVVFRDLSAVVSGLIPKATGPFIRRVIKISFILTALIGGISAKFYSCQYKYADLIGNPTALSFKVGGQIEAALRYLLVFLLLTLGILVAAAATKTIQARRGKG